MIKNNKKNNYARENTTNMDTKEVKQIKEIQIGYLSEKENKYGTNNFFAILDETPLKELIESKDMKKNNLGI